MNAPLGPKTVSFTSASHPPMSSVVNRSFTAGRVSVALAACAVSIGRVYAVLAKMSCASFEWRYFTNSLAMSSTQCASAFLSTTTVGVLIWTVDGGSTSSSSPPAACEVATW